MIMAEKKCSCMVANNLWTFVIKQEVFVIGFIQLTEEKRSLHYRRNSDLKMVP